MHDERAGDRLIGNRLSTDRHCAGAGFLLRLERFELAAVGLVAGAVLRLVLRIWRAGHCGQGCGQRERQSSGQAGAKLELTHNGSLNKLIRS